MDAHSLTIRRQVFYFLINKQKWQHDKKSFLLHNKEKSKKDEQIGGWKK